MSVFETVVRSVIDGLRRAGYALPGIKSLVSVEQQGDHSSVGIVVGLVDKFLSDSFIISDFIDSSSNYDYFVLSCPKTQKFIC